jgi:hypothetical protein
MNIPISIAQSANWRIGIVESLKQGKQGVYALLPNQRPIPEEGHKRPGGSWFPSLNPALKHQAMDSSPK